MTPNAAFIQTGSQLSFLCGTSSIGATFKFLKDGFVVDTGATGIYTIPSVSTLQSGTYTCVVTVNGVDSFSSISHFVTIVGEMIVQILVEIALLPCIATA